MYCNDFMRFTGVVVCIVVWACLGVNPLGMPRTISSMFNAHYFQVRYYKVTEMTVAVEKSLFLEYFLNPKYLQN